MLLKKHWLPVLIIIAGLTGCASSANRNAMMANDVKITTQHERSVAIMTAGGSETGAMDSSNISDEDMKAAIEGSILKNKVFKTIVQGKGADYELQVSIIHLDKPVFGLSFTVNLETTWTLVKQSDRSVVFKQSVKSSNTATFSDSAMGVTRLRIALEGAAQKNIEQGLKAISELNL